MPAQARRLDDKCRRNWFACEESSGGIRGEWDPTRMSERELGKAQRWVREFEEKQQARLRREDNTRKKKQEADSGSKM